MSNKQKLDWNMLEKAAAELPPQALSVDLDRATHPERGDDPSGDDPTMKDEYGLPRAGAWGHRFASPPYPYAQKDRDHYSHVRARVGQARMDADRADQEAASQKWRKTYGTAAAGAGSYGLGAILQRLGETHTDNITKPGKWVETWYKPRGVPNARPERYADRFVGEEGITTKEPYKPPHPHSTHRPLTRLQRLRAALSVEPRYGPVLGRTPAIIHEPQSRYKYTRRPPGHRLSKWQWNDRGFNVEDTFTPQQRVLAREGKWPRGRPPRTPGTPLRHRLPGRLSRLPGAAKGVGVGLGALGLYNLFRGSESD